MKSITTSTKVLPENGFYSYRKVIIMGVKGVGKKTLINSLSDNTKFNESFTYNKEVISTTRFTSRLSDKKMMTLNIVNIGLEDFAAIQPIKDPILMNCDLVLAVTDVTTKNALPSITSVLPLLAGHNIMLVVNKVDRNSEIVLSGKDIATFKEKNSLIEVIEMAKMTKESIAILFDRMYEVLYSKPMSKTYQAVSYMEYLNGFGEESTMKVCLLGNSTVGKTSLMKRFFNNFFNEGMIATIGMEVQKQTIAVNDKRFRFEIWDTAGQEIFRKIPAKHYNKVDAFLVVFDVTSRTSFLAMKDWVEDIKAEAQESVLLFLVGNKIDKIEGREVSQQEGEDLAKELGVKYYEVSCKYGLNVMEIISNVIADLYMKLEHADSSFMLLTQSNLKKRKKNNNVESEGCC